MDKIESTEKILLPKKDSQKIDREVVKREIIEPLNEMWKILSGFDSKVEKKPATNWAEKLNEGILEQIILENSIDAKEIASSIISIFKIENSQHPFHVKIVSLVHKYFRELVEMSAKEESNNEWRASSRSRFLENYLEGIIINSIPTDKIDEMVSLLEKDISIYISKIRFWLENDSRIIDLVIDYGPEALRVELIKVIQNEVENNDCSDIYFLARSHPSWQLQVIFDHFILERVHKLFNIDIDLFLASGHSSTEIDWSKNLVAMRELDSAIPGAVKKLWSEYGIHEFNRYPKEVLIDQITEENIDRPYNIIIFPYADHTGAFDSTDIFRDVDYLKNFYESSKNDFGLKVFETGTTHQTLEYLIKLKKNYRNKISNAVLGGHGNRTSLYFGSLNNSKNESFKLDTKFLQQKRKTFKFVSQFFEQNATIVLISCSTGAESGFASELSEVTNLRVIAPEKDAGLVRLEMKGGTIVPTYINSQAVEFTPKGLLL